MILDLKGKKVVVIGGRNSVGRAIAEAVAREGADVVIWLRKWNDDLNQAEVIPLTQLELPSKQPMGRLHICHCGAKPWRGNLIGDPVARAAGSHTPASDGQNFGNKNAPDR
jgi:NAD(P)-dependent dehydrogenase (short-subunit alcohol dehydrogenase family)